MSVNTAIFDGANSGRAAGVDSAYRLKVTSSAFDGYNISDMDADSDTKYYGYEDVDGNWYIMREVTSTGAYRYTSGSSDYSAAWTARASQIYNYFSVEF